MKYTDPRTGLGITDTDIDPFGAFPPGEKPDDTVMSRAAEAIISASGWRRVFAPDGDEENAAPGIDEAGVVFAVAAAAVAADRFGRGSTVVLGIDSRPTGPAIADVVLRVLRSHGIGVRYLFVAATPEVLACAANDPELSGFVYVSASHNPIAHNGFKLGGADGGVFGGTAAAELAGKLNGLLKDPDRISAEIESARNTSATEVYDAVGSNKHASLGAYSRFAARVLAGPVEESDLSPAPTQHSVLRALESACRTAGVGIVGELNGSARGASIDEEFFVSLGVKPRIINGKPREIVHTIVPEGASLDPCRRALEAAHAEDPGFSLGYVPDNDGDRGNLVYFDDRIGGAKILEAQTVFALACVAESAYVESLCGRSYLEGSTIAVNGPTSMRIDRIAELFGIGVTRAEVGEAYVVGLARRLRKEGHHVRILGEGAAGGTIIHPSSVRDPLSTISAILKLLYLPGFGAPSPLECWCRRVGVEPEKIDGVSTLLETIPEFSTTGAYEARAVLRIEVPNHETLKSTYEKLLPAAWARHSEMLRRRFGIESFRVVNYEGSDERPGVGNRNPEGSGRGGLKVLFLDARRREIAFIWMRGSGTEPVFRVLADLEGKDAEGEQLLLDLQKELIREAWNRSFG